MIGIKANNKHHAAYQRQVCAGTKELENRRKNTQNATTKSENKY